MVKVIDILTNAEKEVNSYELIILDKKSVDFIVSIPHGGRLILSELRNLFNYYPALLRTDLFTEELYSFNRGRTIIFKISSGLVNVSRPKEKSKNTSLPLHLQSGALDAKLITDEEILKGHYSDDQKEMLLGYYDQYHAFIEEEIAEMKKEFGFALMFDCHSMMPKGLKNTPDEGQQRADFVLGSLDDTSADQRLIDVFSETLKKEAQRFGFTVKKNDPYKGGYITRKYGNPQEGVHVLQLEVSRAAYLDEDFSIRGLSNDNLNNENKNNEMINNFKLNLEKMKIVNQIISKVFNATAEEAQRLFG